MKTQLRFVIAFLIITLLSACNNQSSKITPQPSQTPSRLPPTWTPNITTFTPTPTNTRMAVTSVPFAFETPTPLPTPSIGMTDYQLKDWNEESALNLMNLAEQFSFADNIPRPFGEKRFDYQIDQSVVKLAAQEALHRFPDTKYKEKLEWRIALANTILNSSDSDEWILKEIEKALNIRPFKPDNLDQLLNQFGFEIGQQESALNLFGDGQLAQVLWITRQDRDYTGLYTALSQDNHGKYLLTKIYSSWDFNFGYDRPFKIEEHTGDDIPEVIMFPGYSNGSYCGFELVIFQWQNDRFVDASQGQFSFDECGFYPETWKYGTPDKNGIESIESWQSAAYGPAVIRHDRYEWNREWYELSESQILPPDKLDSNAATWIVYAMNEEDYQTIIEKVQQFLSDESQLQAMEPELGQSYPDYLRFQLGLAYAFQANSSQARAILKEIIQNPEDPSTTALSKAAQIYLDNYNGDTDLYRACQATLKVMEQAYGKSPFNRSDVDHENLRQVWGYQPDWFWDSIALCNLSVAFKEITAQLDTKQFTEAPEQLEEAGIFIRSAVEADLDGDGQEEWVLLVDTPGDDTPLNLWVLLKTSNGILPIPVVSWERKQYGLPLKDADTARLNVKTTVSPENTTLTFILVGQHFYTFKLNAVEKSLDQVLWEMDSVEGYALYQRANSLELEITTNDEYCQHCKNTYLWVDDDFVSFSPEEPNQLKISEAEATLTTHWKPNQAISLLQNILDTTSYYGTPRLMYLLGLAYELTGDNSDAIQIYWELWHEYPESAYARLAQAKLELRK